MKVSRIATLATALILSSGVSYAESHPSTPQQWTISTTSESAANAIPVSSSAGAPNPCPAGQQNDNSSDSNPNCFNPLVLTTDWTVSTAQFGNQNVSPVQANTFTNSICSANGGVQTISVTQFDLFSWSQTTVKVTLLDNSGNTDTITFTGGWTQNQSQFSGTFTSAGSCMNGDTGNFTASLFPTINGSYEGSFESSGGSNTGSGIATITFATDSSFNVSGNIVAANGSGLCFSNLMIGSPLADTYAPSIASGELLEAVATDDSGNVVVFTADGTDALGHPMGTDKNGNQKLYVTYTGLSGACSGISGTDIPFTKVVANAQPPRHRPVVPIVFGRMMR